ncbi:ABC transporter permease [Corynebacterium sp. TA-R-1]|uniref:ABC transporter permease n=2 Tax=Corynebacterium stercoris TaxID=2943490 RepID=A0ABT1G2Q1_9CORY|nr:ABC transporter permease [Corynebacterium stercoris]MCP1386987.1 ABC transporter permease [Corynebacterium stercoris]
MTKVSLRNIGAHKLRLALTVLAVVLGTAFIAGSMMFTNMLERTFDSAVATQYKNADAVVEPGEDSSSVPADAADDITKLPTVERANLVGSTTIVAATTDETAIQTRQGRASAAVYYGPDDNVALAPEIIEGRAPEPGNTPAEAVLNANGAEFYGIEMGQELIIVDTGGRERYTVTGFYDDETVQETSLSFLLPEADYREFYVAPDTVPGLLLAGPEGTDPQTLTDEIASAHPELEVRTGEVAAEETSKSVREALSFVSYFLIAFGLVGLLVGTFLIANTFSMIVAQRTKEFALLRALGASRGQVTRSVLAEAVIVGLLGSVLGVAGGAGLVALIKQVMQRYNMDLPAGGIGFALDTAIVPIVAGVIVTVISAWAPARQAGRVQPVEAMRASESAAPQPLRKRTLAGAALIAAGIAAAVGALLWEDGATADRASLVGVAAVAVIAGIFLAGPAMSLPVVPPLGRLIGAPFGTVGRLASTNTQRNPRRTSATAFALMLGIALVTIIGMLGASMKHSVDTVAENEVGAEYVLAGPDMAAFPIPRDLMERLPEVDGVGAVAAYTEAAITVDGEYSATLGEFGSTTVLYGDPGDLITLEMAEGSSSLDGNTVIAPRAWAEERGWKVGDTVTIAAPGISPLTVEATVGGIFEESSMLPAVVVSADAATQILPPGAVNIIMLGVSGDGTVDSDQLRANLEAEVKQDIVVQVKSKDDISGEVLDLIDQMLFILYALLSLAVVIAVLGIVNTLTLSVIERRQEIGMLRAVGTHRRQVRIMIILESVQMAFFGAVLGVLLGLGLGWTFLTVLADQGLEQIVIPWGLVAQMLGGSVLVGILAALWPANRAAKTPPLDAIAD